jgi:hypothetical protein
MPAAVMASSQLADEPTARVRLARAALQAALAVPGVVRGEAGGGVPRVTLDATGRLDGVLAVAQPDGRYAIELRLVARLVPLQALAEAVRARVRTAAARAELDASLGEVDVEFADLLTAEEIARAALAAEARTTRASVGHAGGDR